MATDRQSFVQWLKEQHELIMGCERQALECLDAGDKDGYALHMHAKAENLKDLDRLSKARLKELDNSERDFVEGRISRFSSGAATALSLDSLFYMSALLYPDDHKPGEPDNLMRLIQDMENKSASSI